MNLIDYSESNGYLKILIRYHGGYGVYGQKRAWKVDAFQSLLYLKIS